jgi:hypothetical protein
MPNPRHSFSCTQASDISAPIAENVDLVVFGMNELNTREVDIKATPSWYAVCDGSILYFAAAIANVSLT